jgi:chitodextrinase
VVSATYRAVQVAGDLNVVVVGWNDTISGVQSVTDSSGNAYIRAVGPTLRTGLGQQSIYYAAGIGGAAAGANTVTVKFDRPAEYVDLRIAEYHGISTPSPVDVVTGASGSSSSNTSGSVTTTAANALLVGANLVAKSTQRAGAGFTSRVITSPDGDILEDRVVTTTGSYSATATTTGGAYVMQMVAFRIAGPGGDTEPPSSPTGLTASAPSATQVTLQWAASADNIGVTSYLIERCAGPGCSGFAQIGTTATTAYSDNAVGASTSFSYRIRATDAAGNLSGYSASATVTTPAAPDTQAPTAPTSLTASAPTTTQVALTWNPSSDDTGVTGYLIERCEGTSCSAFSQLGTTATPAYVDGSVSASTSYRYRVRATDAAGNLSAYSAVASVTTLAAPDTDPPTAPASLAATADSASQITLTWLPSSDNAGVTGYLVERCQGLACGNFTQVGTASATTFVDAGVAAATTYGYRVRATDAAGNLSTYSATAAATTPAANVGIRLVQHAGVDAGNTNAASLAFPAPTTAGNWIGVAVRAGQAGQTITVTDSRGNTYRKAIQLNEDVDGVTLALYYAEAIAGGADTVSVSSSLPGGLLRFALFEYAGVAAANSFDGGTTAQGTSTTAASGSFATTVPGDLLIGMVTTANGQTFTAGAGFTLQERVPASNSKLGVEDRTQSTAGSTSAQFALSSSDVWGALAAAFKPAAAGPPDTQAPSVPGALTATAPSSGQVTLAWTASSDDTGVTGYAVERCTGASCSAFLPIATTTSPGFTDGTVIPSTTYGYRVRASDAAGNASEYSNIASATTSAPPDTQAPTAPSSLTAAATSPGEITLGWTGSTDNVGVTAYLIERCQGTSCTSFSQVGSSPSPAFADSTVAASTSYRYRVRAVDAESNLSTYSNIATATTPAVPDAEPPSAPGTLTATASSASQVALSWGAASDNVAVTGYAIERCQGTGCSNFSQVGTWAAVSFTDTGVQPATPYSYRVRASDGAGNTGAYSNTATVTTPAVDSTGLIAAFSFDEGAGTAVPDLSGHGNDGSISGAIWTSAGYFGGALSFTGSSKVVVADNPSLDLTTGVTLEAWVRPSTVTGGWRDVIYKGNDTYYLEATTPSGVPAAGLTLVSAGNSNTYAPSALAVNTWTHLAQTFDGSVVRLYVNGVQVASQNRSGTLVTSTYPLEIGGDSIYGQYFQGLIDEVRVYNVARTAVQIQGDMAAPLAATTPVVSLSPASLDFGQQQVGGPTTARLVTLTNAGSAPLAIASIGITGANAAEFAQTGTCGATLIAGAACTISVTFTPAAEGVRSADLVIQDDAAGSPQRVPLSGSGTVAQPVDNEPPSAPGPLSAVAASGTQVNLSWVAATDNVGVTGYRVERCQGAGCSVFIKLGTPATTTFTDTGLTPNTSYSYVVLATDAAGNLGPYSNVATVTTASTIPELVAAYSFNEGSGTVAVDVSGTGNNGAIGTATWTTDGKFGGALSFNGSSKVVIPDSASLDLTTGVTLEAWVKPSVINSGWRDVIYKGNDTYYLEASTQTNGGVPAAGVSLSSSDHTNTFGPSTLPVNTWTHLAMTYDAAVVRLYVNGVQVASSNLAGRLVTSSYPLEIGGDGIFGQFFQGIIDEVRVYNVARTPTQIQADMVIPVGSDAPVVGLSTNLIDFGKQAIGVGAPPTTVTLTNIGGGSMNIGSISVTGADAGDFARTTTCGSALSPGASCAIAVSFLAGGSGVRAAAISIADDAPGAPHVVALQGSGVPVLVLPGTATVSPGHTQQFTATSAGGSSYEWSVDGIVGGSATIGTISSGGLYTGPSQVGSHVITATDQASGASGTATVYAVSYAGTFTFHNDNARSGANLSETVLTPGNVNPTTFGKLKSFDIDGQAYASPLYVPSVDIPGQGTHNVVYVATEHDSVYAFDADGNVTAPLWKVSFIDPANGITTVSPDDVGECCDITPEIGITGTPVIDPATGTLYVVAKTKEVSGGVTNFVQRLHALDIATGAEKLGGPVVIQATVPGTGQGSSGGQLQFLPLRENQRPALLLNNGIVYIAFGSHGDRQPYHGWLLGYDAATLAQRFAYCDTANGEGAGIWLANSGPAADSAGNIYLITGDGTFDANRGGTNFGDSYIKVGPLGTVLDYFTPYNESTLDNGNIDLGAGGVLLLPDQPGAHPHLMLSAGKNGTIDLIDRDNMGQFNAGSDSQIVQTLPNIFPFGTPEPGNYSAPVYFNGMVYFSPVADAVQAFSLTDGRLSTTATSRSSRIFSYPGGTLSLSASRAENAILWALERRNNASGALRAYDARNLGVELYNTDQAGSRDSLDEVVKFSAPLVANGKVYVATATKLTIFGLLQ